MLNMIINIKVYYIYGDMLLNLISDNNERSEQI